MERVIFLPAPVSDSSLSLMNQGGFQCAGVRQVNADGKQGKEWIFVRAGIETPLVKQRERSVIVVFDLNHVLGVKWFDPAGRWHCPSQVQARCDQQVFFVRPGARKLLRMCHAARFDVYIWTTMQHRTASAFVKLCGFPIPPGKLFSADDCDHDGGTPIKDLDILLDGTRRQGQQQPSPPSSSSQSSSSLVVVAFDDDPAKFKAKHQTNLQVVPKYEPAHPYDHKALVDRGCEWMLQKLVECTRIQ